ncbi:hypothetical protein NQD34_002361 [Periophthalmus magnuspinnatus]|nr:hypothetical protein NQD34_002361 [Periophthalmus magnuspinnatus]
MPSPVTNAMIESYALMVMVMGTFFVYFCGMVWAFCNPKLSDGEEDCDGAELGDQAHTGAPHLPVPPYGETYINFWDDTDSLITACNGFYREEHGINNMIIATQNLD